MKFSTKTRYAIRAMIEIAMDKTQSGVFQKDIAKNQQISVKYLDHIIPSLKTVGLISNLKGKKSGYILTRKPSEITMYEIHKAFEPDVCVVDCLDNKNICKREKECVARQFWSGLNNHVIKYLSEITLDDLLKKQMNSNQNTL